MDFSNAVLKNDDELMELEDLKAKTIVDIGFVQGATEGGLTIDYKDGPDIKRIVVGYNDLGTWLAWQGIKGEVNLIDTIKDKVAKACEKIVYNFEKINIVDDPRCLRYKFLNDSEEFLFLTINELKILPEVLRKYFQVKEKSETVQEFMLRLYTWAIN